MTEEIFHKNVAYLRSIAPASRWLSELSSYSAATVVYLKCAIKEAEHQPILIQEESKKVKEKSLNLLYIKKSKLFTDRAILSNKMNALPEHSNYDSQRKEFSIKIELVQDQIENIFDEIDIEKGLKNRIEKAEKIKDNIQSLIKRQKSLPVQICNLKKQVEHATGEAKALKQKKLSSLEEERNTVNAAIKNYNHQQ